MTPQEILTAALSNPDALWAILTADVKVAGPWSESGMRVTGRGVCVALVCNAHGSWFGEVFLTRDEEAKRCSARVEAESWCDAKLREAGWLLASGEVERG